MVRLLQYMRLKPLSGGVCFRNTDPWKQWPRRMLRHKAAIQCARVAFGISGVMEPDEAERFREMRT
jgi:hypothetical protein